MTARLGLVALLAAALATGCESGIRDMYEQPRIDAYSASPLFTDGQSARPPLAGTVPRSRGRLAYASSGREAAFVLPLEPSVPVAPGGRFVNGQWLPNLSGLPMPVTRQLLERGRGRYEIFCAPCHSPVGDGDGMIVRRGFTAPPTYHSAGMRNIPDTVIYDAITNGVGMMSSYADRVSPEDRWAIVAWIRTLQLSRYAPVAELDAVDRDALEALAP